MDGQERGPNLQVLIAANLIPADKANLLGTELKDRIELLTSEELTNLLAVCLKIGPGTTLAPEGKMPF